MAVGVMPAGMEEGQGMETPCLGIRSPPPRRPRDLSSVCPWGEGGWAASREQSKGIASEEHDPRAAPNPTVKGGFIITKGAGNVVFEEAGTIGSEKAMWCMRRVEVNGQRWTDLVSPSCWFVPYHNINLNMVVFLPCLGWALGG